MAKTVRLTSPPMLADSKWVKEQAREGMSVPAYVYPDNNPLHFTEPDGRAIRVDAEHSISRLFETIRKLDDCPCVHQFFNKCFGCAPFPYPIDHWLFAYGSAVDAPWCVVGYGWTVGGLESTFARRLSHTAPACCRRQGWVRRACTS